MKYSKTVLWLILFTLSSVTDAQQPFVIRQSMIDPSCYADTENCIECAASLKQNLEPEKLQWLLSYAIYGDMEQCVVRLIALGIDPNPLSETKFSTPLNIAARFNATKSIRHLIEAGADPDQPDIFGVLPVFLAVTSNHCTIIPLLFSRGGNPNPLVNYNNQKLSIFSVATLENRFECIRELTLLGVDINKLISGERDDTNGLTPLTQCLMGGHMDLAKQFVFELNANPEVRNFRGDTALLVMVKSGHIEAVKLLTKELGADISALDSKHESSIDIAYRSGNQELAFYLEEYQRNQTLLYQLIDLYESTAEIDWREFITYTVSTLALALIPATLLLGCFRKCCSR